MKLSALTLAIGILTPLYIASAQSRPATAATPPCPSGVAGPFYVYILGKGFQPSLPYNTDPNKSYAPPASTTILTLTLPPNITPDTPAMVADLTEAFANAPSFFLQQLCGLDGIFISVKDCTNFANYICSGSLTPAQITQDSWGYREGPWQFAPGSPPGHYGRYIAISAGPWSTATSHAPTYSGYELMLLQLLLPWADTVPTYAANAAADTSAMAVLAASPMNLAMYSGTTHSAPPPADLTISTHFVAERFLEILGGPWIRHLYGVTSAIHKMNTNFMIQIYQI